MSENTTTDTTTTKAVPDWIAGYVRVSTADQNSARQVAAIEEYVRNRWGEAGLQVLHKEGCGIREDKASGKTTKGRDALEELLRTSRHGDFIIAHSPDRVARNNGDLSTIMQKLADKGVTLVYTKYPELDTSTPTGKLMLAIMAIFAEFERDLILERQREGIAAAQKAGKYKPRALNSQQVEYAKKQYEAGTPKAQIARELGISRASLYRYLNGDTRPSDAD